MGVSPCTRRFVIFAALLVMGSVDVCAASPRPSTPQEILAKLFTPGERSRLAAVHTFVASGTVSLGKQHGTITTYWKSPNRFITVTKYVDESGSYAAGFDGRKGWFAYPQGVLEGLGRNEAVNDCPGLWLSNSDLFPQRWPTEVRYAGWRFVQGTPALWVTERLHSCAANSKIFDATTGSRIGLNRLPDGTIGPDRHAPMLHGPYGFVLPAFGRVALHNPPLTGRYLYTSLRVNVPLDDAMFVAPHCFGQCVGKR